MINFEEELKKFHPSLEVEDAEEAIYNQDLTDVADLLVKMIKEAEEKSESSPSFYSLYGGNRSTTYLNRKVIPPPVPPGGSAL